MNDKKDENGKYVAIYAPSDPFWATEKGQADLEEFYRLEKLASTNKISLEVYFKKTDQVIHPGKLCPLRDYPKHIND